MKTGIVLYGPPTSGKDTVTAALIEQDPRLVLPQFPNAKLPANTDASVFGCSLSLGLSPIQIAGVEPSPN